jgi:hypothetical protein
MHPPIVIGFDWICLAPEALTAIEVPVILAVEEF